MSTLWTPSGEHRVPKPDEASPGGPATSPPTTAPSPVAGHTQGGRTESGLAAGGREPTPEEVQEAQAELDAMRAQLLEAPVEMVIANHAMGLWELAALHLSSRPPQLPQAQLAIDALSSLVDGMQGRLGEAEKTLTDGLAQIRMAFVQVHAAEQARPTGG